MSIFSWPSQNVRADLSTCWSPKVQITHQIWTAWLPIRSKRGKLFAQCRSERQYRRRTPTETIKSSGSWKKSLTLPELGELQLFGDRHNFRLVFNTDEVRGDFGKVSKQLTSHILSLVPDVLLPVNQVRWNGSPKVTHDYVQHFALKLVYKFGRPK